MRQHLHYVEAVILCLLIGVAGCSSLSSSRSVSSNAVSSNTASSTIASSSSSRVNNLQSDAPKVITVVGSTAANPMLQELTAEFRRLNPEIIFDIRGGGSLYGETQIHGRKADLAISTLIVAPQVAPALSIDASIELSETAQIAAEPVLPESELMRTPIALSGLAIIVHESNSVAGFTLEQLQTIYSGRVLQWGDAAGYQTETQADTAGPGEILLVSREEFSSARTVFDERVMGDEQLSLTSIIVPFNRAVLESVATNERAIGYVDRAYIVHLLPTSDTESTELPVLNELPIRVLTVEGLLPERDAIASQQYPLLYPMHLVYHTSRQPFERELAQKWADEFAQFIAGDVGQRIIERYHVLIR